MTSVLLTPIAAGYRAATGRKRDFPGVVGSMVRSTRSSSLTNMGLRSN